MLRLILFLIGVTAAAAGLSWLADRPGEISVNWQGYRIDTDVFWVTVGLSMLVVVALAGWSLLRHLWESPATLGRYFQRRKQSRGLDALSSGMIAIGAGDRDSAVRYAVQARKSLPNEPLTHLLRAQAAQLAGDPGTSRRIFEAMLAAPDTEQLGLRGLYLEAIREKEEAAALQFAQRALKLNPKLEWAATSLFELQCKRSDWAGALDTLSVAKRNGFIEKASADRRRAVLLTAQAQPLEDENLERALNLAVEAHRLAPDLIPAGAIAGRLLISKGNTARAAKVIQKTWKTSAHPDLAVAYAYARIGDSPKDRLERVRKLAALNPHSIESPIAVATAAIEAKDFGVARMALKPLLDGRLTQRVCTLMARIEGGDLGNRGRVREWLARAVNAPRDPVWTADGVVSDAWAPVSHVTGALDAFQWRVPVENLQPVADGALPAKIDEFVALGAPEEAAVPREAASSDVEAELDSLETGEMIDAVAVEEEETTADAVVEARKDAPVATAPEVSAPLKPKGKRGADSSSRTATKGESDVSSNNGAISESAATTPTKPGDNGKVGDDAQEDSVPQAAGEVPVTASPSTKQAARPSKSQAPDNAKAEKDPEPPAKEPKPTTKTSKPQAAKEGASKAKKSKPQEHRVFVSPPAPDDPGTENVLEYDETAAAERDKAFRRARRR